MITVFQTKMKINTVYECIFGKKNATFYISCLENVNSDNQKCDLKKRVRVIFFLITKKIQTSKNSLQN